MMPRVALRDFSGVRFGLPPSWFWNCASHSRPAFTYPPIGVEFGQRIGSLWTSAVFERNCGRNMSESVGARKPVLYEVRTRISRVGVQRSETFGFVVEPKSL